MRLRAFAASALLFPLLVIGQQPSQPAPAPAPPPMVSTTGSASGHHYTTSTGQRVHSPMRAASAPSGASAKCRDGSYSFSQHARGTCSHHGGVGNWLIH